MRPLLIVAALLAPATAAAADSEIVGSLEFTLGFGDALEVDGESDRQPSLDTDLSPTLAITPGLDKMLGKVVGVGFEYMFVWFGTESEDTTQNPYDERRFAMSPHVRVRMSFPIVDKITFDGMLGVGPTIWTSLDGVDEDDKDPKGGGTRFGWSLRFGFGGSYKFNDQVAAYAHLGYLTSTTFGDDLEMTVTSVPLSAGLRSSF